MLVGINMGYGAAAGLENNDGLFILGSLDPPEPGKLSNNAPYAEFAAAALDTRDEPDN